MIYFFETVDSVLRSKVVQKFANSIVCNFIDVVAFSNYRNRVKLIGVSSLFIGTRPSFPTRRAAGQRPARRTLNGHPHQRFRAKSKAPN